MKKYLDKQLFIILIAYMVSYNVVYVVRRVFLKGMGRPEYDDFSWWSTIFEPFISSFVIVPGVILFIMILTKFLIDSNVKWPYVFAVHFVLSFVYSFVLTAFGYLYNSIFYGTDLSTLSLEDFFVATLFGSNLNYLGYVGFVAITYCYFYFQKINNAELQKAQLARQLQDVRLQVLKSQLNPHFLFNTLNAIASLVHEDPSKAQQTISNLGDLLRDVLQVKNARMISVAKELAILKKYIEIMQLRFSDHLTFQSTIDEEVKDILIPSMLLQPIIENAFKHGYAYNYTKLHVSLSIYKKVDRLVIDIINNGTPIKSNQKDGLGITNIKESLKTLYGSRYKYLFKNLEDQAGVITTIEIPLTRMQE